MCDLLFYIVACVRRNVAALPVCMTVRHVLQVADMYNAQAIHGVKGGIDAADEEY